MVLLTLDHHPVSAECYLLAAWKKENRNRRSLLQEWKGPDQSQWLAY